MKCNLCGIEYETGIAFETQSLNKVFVCGDCMERMMQEPRQIWKEWVETKE